MENKKDDKITELIVSYGTEMIGTRFMVKVSKFDSGTYPENIIIIVRDLIENGFTIKNFKNMDAAASFLKLLAAAAK